MEPPPSWTDYGSSQIGCIELNHTSKDDVADSFAEEKCTICVNSVVPDDILEQVLGHLPVATIIKLGCVCKKWNDMVHSGRFIRNLSNISSQKPWYFMFTRNSDPHGHVYDPMLSKWYSFDIPYVETPSWNLVSSSGLLCYMDNDYRRKIYVCNPLTKHCRKLEEPPGEEICDYCALAITLNRSSPSFTVTIVRSKQAPGEELYWDLSINVYSSENKTWTSPVDVSLRAWRGGADSVICHGVLYFVVYLTRPQGYLRPRYGLMAYDLASQPFDLDVDQHVISAPCPVTCMRLMNLEEELVMVGGIEKQGRSSIIIKGIGIWVLRGTEWEEVSRMPHKFFKGSGEFDDVFACSGFNKLIYIHSYGSPVVIMFDMDSKQWKWSHKCPIPKKFPHQIFSGICFEPRLDFDP